jgi:hypothetical protein
VRLLLPSFEIALAVKQGVADEVHLVAAIGQLQTELGRDDAAAAVGGIASDSDLHIGKGNIAARARQFSDGPRDADELIMRTVLS